MYGSSPVAQPADQKRSVLSPVRARSICSMSAM
jgi:hypothetical protein